MNHCAAAARQIASKLRSHVFCVNLRSERAGVGAGRAALRLPAIWREAAVNRATVFFRHTA